MQNYDSSQHLNNFTEVQIKLLNERVKSEFKAVNC